MHQDGRDRLGNLPPFRIKALTGILDGRVIGIAGVGFPADGVVIAFADLTDAVRAHRFALHRAALRFLAQVGSSGIARLVATSDPHSVVAGRWLKRLGFSFSHADVLTERSVWVWLARS